jgi:hypothetical protein
MFGKALASRQTSIAAFTVAGLVAIGWGSLFSRISRSKVDATRGDHR